MAPRLIGQKGLLTGLELELIGGPSWVLGRDPDEVDFILEDPSVSRTQARINRSKEGIYVISNLSQSNPTRLHGEPLQETTILKAGDSIQMGGTWFAFEPLLNDQAYPPSDDHEDEESPVEHATPEESLEEEAVEEDLILEDAEPTPPPRSTSKTSEESIIELPSRDTIFEIHEGDLQPFLGEPQWRYLLKVLSGPNQGAEFGLQQGHEYVLGKDPVGCAIVLNDLSVSRRQCIFRVADDGEITVEDLESRNGTLVDGQLIDHRTTLNAHSVIQVGTTSMALFDREHAGETVIRELAPPPPPPTETEQEELSTEEAAKEDWKDQPISVKSIYMLLGVSGAVLCVVVMVMALMRVETIEITRENPEKRIQKALHSYPSVQFSFNPTAQTLLLLGHVLTPTDLQELAFQLQQLNFVTNVENYVIADSNLWQEMNLLLARNPSWGGVTMYAKEPGRFIVSGAVTDAATLQSLQEYLNLNFSYRDRLDIQVVVQANLQDQINAELARAGLNSVAATWDAGQLTLRGSVVKSQEKNLQEIVQQLKTMPGINTVDNLVLAISEQKTVDGVVMPAKGPESDISSKYKVSGWITGPSGRGVVINGNLYFAEDQIDGMRIMAIEATSVQLVKDGVEYKIKYNGTSRGA